MQVTHTIYGEGSLFFQSQALIIKRMIDGIWPSSERLPSEFALTKEFKASLGTVRKANDATAHENLIICHQGCGTFASSHSDQSKSYQFFHLFKKNDTTQSPQKSHLISYQRRKCSPKESRHLKISKAAYVLNIRQVRSIGGIPFIIENIVVPDALITELGKKTEILNKFFSNISKLIEKLFIKRLSICGLGH